MSKLVDDVKSGLKGIRGAGDALRGNLMEATDQALDPDSGHPAAQASQSKNRAIAEKGKQDIAGADEMIARREQKHQHGGVPANTSTYTGTHTGTAPAPGTTQGTTVGQGFASGGAPASHGTTHVQDHASTGIPHGQPTTSTGAADGTAGLGGAGGGRNWK